MKISQYPIKLALTSCIGIIVTHHGVAEVLPPGRQLWERKTRERTSPNHAVREGCSGGGSDSGEVQGVVGGNINFDIGRR